MIETKTNFHTHCQRCRHAFGTEEDYLKSAIEKNLDQLGFSDHAPFPDHDFGNRMPFEELPDYISAIEQLITHILGSRFGSLNVYNCSK